MVSRSFRSVLRLSATLHRLLSALTVTGQMLSCDCRVLPLFAHTVLLTVLLTVIKRYIEEKGCLLVPFIMASYSFKGNDWLFCQGLLKFLFHFFDTFLTNIMLPQLTNIITGQIKCVIAAFRDLTNIDKNREKPLIISLKC